MRQASAKFWIGGTAFVAVLLLVAAWFLAVEPVVARAAEDTASAEQQRQQNDLLQMEIVKLAEEFTHLEEYKAELAALRVQLPADADQSGMSRELQILAESSGITLVTLSPSVPEPVVAAAAPAPAETPVAEADATDGNEVAAEAAPTPAQASGFYAIPISMSTIGSYDATVTFLRSLQEGASRLYLVSSIGATTQEASGASGGRPATAEGDLALAISGFAFVLLDQTAVPEEPVGDGALPVPGGEVNPFQPGR